MVYMRLDIVNKYQYEESENYKEIKILCPKDSQELEEDFKYLGLDYKNLGLQDTHVKECEFICEEDPDFSVNLTGEINNLIIRASKKGFTTPFQSIKEFQNLISNFQSENRDKLLAVLEAEHEHIENIQDVIRYTKRLNMYYLDRESLSPEEYARSEIHYGELYMEDVLPYIDAKRLGKDLIEDRNAKLTQYGVLCNMNDGIEEIKEDEEEME